MKKNEQQMVRQDLRNKLNNRHKAIIELEIKSGVRLGMQTQQQRDTRNRTGDVKRNGAGY